MIGVDTDVTVDLNEVTHLGALMLLVAFGGVLWIVKRGINVKVEKHHHIHRHIEDDDDELS